MDVGYVTAKPRRRRAAWPSTRYSTEGSQLRHNTKLRVRWKENENEKEWHKYHKLGNYF
jgi:hypothetical protein